MKNISLALALFWFILSEGVFIFGESSACLTKYDDSQSVFHQLSPKCPCWKPPSLTSRCQMALHQGRRKQQEDRAICSQDILFPFLGPEGITCVRVGIVGIFDGHNGAEASEMASQLFLDYFIRHTFFLLDNTLSILLKKLERCPLNRRWSDLILKNEELGQHQLKFERFELSFSSVFRLEIFKEAALRAIHDIDSTYSKDALRENFRSGCTATIILMAENKIFAAYIGDSKAFLCSQDYKYSRESRDALLRIYRQTKADSIFQPFTNYRAFESITSNNGWAFLTVKELTKDHHPDRDDERNRLESFGGNVSEWGGVARVNGQLAVSRAIGDVFWKRYGVISEPEITDWQPLTANDRYLIAASDGVFEKQSSQDVCDILSVLRADIAVKPELNHTCTHSLADCLLSAAYEKGSTDNMAAIIVPFIFG